MKSVRKVGRYLFSKGEKRNLGARGVYVIQTSGNGSVSWLSIGAACALFLFLVEKSSKSTSNSYKNA
jgi:hypothetical protein